MFLLLNHYKKLKFFIIKIRKYYFFLNIWSEMLPSSLDSMLTLSARRHIRQNCFHLIASHCIRPLNVICVVESRSYTEIHYVCLLMGLVLVMSINGVGGCCMSIKGVGGGCMSINGVGVGYV